jgi:hypothetical protein
MKRITIEISKNESPEVKIKIDQEDFGEVNDHEKILADIFMKVCSNTVVDLSQMAHASGAKVIIESPKGQINNETFKELFNE